MVAQQSRCLIVVVLTLSLAFCCLCQEQCTESETCTTTCNFDADLCKPSASVYDNGGTAVTFRPLSTTKTTVCSQENVPYKISNWMGRRASWKSAPQVSLRVDLLGCHSNDQECCCSSIPGSVQVWQTRPNGSFPPLGNIKSDECRGYQEGASSFHFETLAPGSVGLMGGLGPNGWDAAPYVGPVIHLLAQAGVQTTPVLVNIPIHPNPTTLQQARFYGPNFHGSAWVQSKSRSSSRYQISSWTALPDENRIEITVEVFLAASPTGTNLETSLCPSMIYGFPGSFFTEPIGLCAPVLLDFLSL